MTDFKTLISPEDLTTHIDDPGWVFVDCRFSLADPTLGQQLYERGHIPGAVYANLDKDLSGPPTTDYGRHPLPPPEKMISVFSNWGIGSEIQVVVYDDANGKIAARLWWMLRYMGHTAVALLDGGWQEWLKLGLPTKSGLENNANAGFTGTPRREWLIQLSQVADLPLLIDSRAPERYRGETEPIDPVAGHIPGAVSLFYEQHWAANGRYLSPEEIRQNFQRAGVDQAGEVVFHCGSGVSACVNLLAMAHAGLGNGRLYVGSWSEWCRTPGLPIAVD